MTGSEIDDEVEVAEAAALILIHLDNVQEQLARIRHTAERLAKQQQEAKDAPDA